MKRSAIAAVAAGALALSLAACGSDSSNSSTTNTSGAPATENVTYLTSFGSFGRDAYAYIADKQGFFAEEGLNVTIEPGAGTVEVSKLVASGKADFGAGDFPTVAISIANEDLPIKAVSMVHQHSLAAVITLEGNGIEKPVDLAGKRIADTPGSTNQVIFPVYAKAAGFDAKDTEFVPSPPPGLTQLLVSGQVDAVGNFTLVKPLIEAAASGKGAIVFPYAEALPDLYGISIIASNDTIEKNPELVERFNRAILKGLKYSIENPEESADVIMEVSPTADRDVAIQEVEIMAPNVTAENSIEVGTIDPDRVQTVLQILEDAGAMEKDLNTEDVVFIK